MSKVVVALGNPGREYAGTRHNIGFAVLQAFIDQEELSLTQKWRSLCAKWASADIWMMAPQTYMNESGRALEKALRDIEVEIEDFLVIHDDLNLPVGSFRFKKGGGESGHKGLLSVSKSLKSKEYARLRIGIGPRPSGDLSEFVLKSFSNEEKDAIFPLFPQLLGAIKKWGECGSDVAMNAYNENGSK